MLLGVARNSASGGHARYRWRELAARKRKARGATRAFPWRTCALCFAQWPRARQVSRVARRHGGGDARAREGAGGSLRVVPCGVRCVPPLRPSGLAPLLRRELRRRGRAARASPEQRALPSIGGVARGASRAHACAAHPRSPGCDGWPLRAGGHAGDGAPRRGRDDANEGHGEPCWRARAWRATCW
jgi:hypothetical protein